MRVPVGALANEPALADVAPGGAAPSVVARYGLGPSADLGIEASGTTARALLRGQLGDGMVRVQAGLGPHVGVGHEGGELVRAGGTLPLALTIDVLSLFEVWVGARVVLEHLTGAARSVAISMTGIVTGGVVGLGVGFRRFLVLVELGVDHELWTGTVADMSIERSGLVLTPAFAVRLRL